MKNKIFKIIPILLVAGIFAFVIFTMLFVNLPYNDTTYGKGRNMYQLIADPNFDTDTVTSLVMMIMLVGFSLPIHLGYSVYLLVAKKESPFFYIFPLIDSLTVVTFTMIMAIVDCDCAHSNGAIPMIITGFIAMLIAWAYFFYSTAHFVVSLIEFIKEKRTQRIVQ